VKRYVKRKAEIFPAWQEILRANWDERFLTTKYDWRTFRGQIVVSPFRRPSRSRRAVRPLRDVEEGMSSQISKLCGQPVSEKDNQDVDTDPLKLDPQIVATRASAIAARLSLDAGVEVSDLSQAGEGRAQGRRLAELHLEVRDPLPETWLFYPGGNKPSIRLSFKPPEVRTRRPRASSSSPSRSSTTRRPRA